MKNPLLLSTTINHCPQPPRQRIDLKGPRVKHVCRSASVALGQPIATFPSIDGKEYEPEATKSMSKSQKDDERPDKKEASTKEKENSSQKSNQENYDSIQTSCAKRNKCQQNILQSNHRVVRKRFAIYDIIFDNTLYKLKFYIFEL